MLINKEVVASLDDSDLSRFIKFVYNAVVLFDATVDEKFDFDPERVISLSSPVCDTWHVPEYSIPIFRLLHIEETDDRFVVLHYAKSKTFCYDCDDDQLEESFDDNEEELYIKGSSRLDYILFFSYRCCGRTTVLNDNYSELYKLLIDEKLLDAVETELEKIVLMLS